MLRSSVLHGADSVILTGTGSGKTESIYLPVLAALVEIRHMARASFARRGTTGGRCRRHWARETALPSAHLPARAQQGGRRPAIRALVLYPLNALAEDQMARLRLALDGDQVRAWLGANRPGNRFWFGRYTGWTPLSGPPDRDGAEGELRAELQRLSSMAARVAGTDAERFFPRFDGGEAWSRWDMQDAPPDVLITNYSMLNIMLMRDVEDPIFDQTRQWLESIPPTSFIS